MGGTAGLAGFGQNVHQQMVMEEQAQLNEMSNFNQFLQQQAARSDLPPAQRAAFAGWSARLMGAPLGQRPKIYKQLLGEIDQTGRNYKIGAQALTQATNQSPSLPTPQGAPSKYLGSQFGPAGTGAVATIPTGNAPQGVLMSPPEGIQSPFAGGIGYQPGQQETEAWQQQMKGRLAAIDNSNLTPEQKERARGILFGIPIYKPAIAPGEPYQNAFGQWVKDRIDPMTGQVIGQVAVGAPSYTQTGQKRLIVPDTDPGGTGWKYIFVSREGTPLGNEVRGAPPPSSQATVVSSTDTMKILVDDQGNVYQVPVKTTTKRGPAAVAGTSTTPGASPAPQPQPARAPAPRSTPPAVGTTSPGPQPLKSVGTINKLPSDVKQASMSALNAFNTYNQMQELAKQNNSGNQFAARNMLIQLAKSQIAGGGGRLNLAEIKAQADSGAIDRRFSRWASLAMQGTLPPKDAADIVSVARGNYEAVARNAASLWATRAPNTPWPAHLVQFRPSTAFQNGPPSATSAGQGARRVVDLTR